MPEVRKSSADVEKLGDVPCYSSTGVWTDPVSVQAVVSAVHSTRAKNRLNAVSH